jgi:hypothetical protein
MTVGDLNIYYPANLQTKEGYCHISIILKKLFFFRWVEVEGAKAIVVYE